MGINDLQQSIDPPSLCIRASILIGARPRLIFSLELVSRS